MPANRALIPANAVLFNLAIERRPADANSRAASGMLAPVRFMASPISFFSQSSIFKVVNSDGPASRRPKSPTSITSPTANTTALSIHVPQLPHVAGQE